MRPFFTLSAVAALLAAASIAHAGDPLPEDSPLRRLDPHAAVAPSDWDRGARFEASPARAESLAARSPNLPLRGPAKADAAQAPIECGLPVLPGSLGSMGCEEWVTRYDGPGAQIDDSYWVIPSPDGSKVFVAGASVSRETYDDYAVVAYDAATGAELWVRRWDGGGATVEQPYPIDVVNSFAVSPDGSKVFATGHSWTAGGGFDYATLALDAATGDSLWVARYNGPGNFDDVGLAVTVAPDGSRLFVGGTSYGDGTLYDYATVAYDAATGGELWVARYGGPANFQDWITSIAVSPDGSRVFAYGWSDAGDAASWQDYATVAYDAATGAQIWVSRYNGPGNNADNSPLVTGHKIAVSPDGSRVVVTGTSMGVGTNTDHATVCYDATSGAECWVSRYNGPASKADGSNALAFHPDGSKVFVTGTSYDNISKQDVATRAIDVATGTQLWVSLYSGPANQFDSGLSIAVGPLGEGVYVTGFSTNADILTDFVTVAYEPLNGAQRWVERYDGLGGEVERGACVAADPVNARVYITGRSKGDDTDFDYATVAYDAANGTQLWDAHYNGPGYSGDFAMAMAVAPGTGTVFVAGHGSVDGGGNNGEYALAAYAPATGAELWVETHSIARNKIDRPAAVAVSPDGARVFVSGGGYVSALNSDYVTVAYEAASGGHLWTSSYNGPSDHFDAVRAMVVSPDGARVFVTGTSYDDATFNDYATVAYDAATGAELWAVRYDGGAAGPWDEAWALDVAPDGSAVYVTGAVYNGAEPTKDVMTVAYDAATGGELWQARTAGAASGMDEPRAIRASPDGARVFLTGWSSVTGGRCSASLDCDLITVALDASTGAEMWRYGYAGTGALADQGRVMEVSPDGGRVFVAGAMTESTGGINMRIIANDAANGAELWSTEYFSSGPDFPNALQVSANGRRVYVAGNGGGAPLQPAFPDYATAALDAATGNILWGHTYDGYVGVAAKLAADGSRIFVAGTAYDAPDWDIVTVSYFITQPPDATLSPEPASGEPPLAVTFMLGASDPDGTIDSWKLDVDCDGVSEYGGAGAPPATLEHTYPEPGEFTACLAVLDSLGASGRDTAPVTVVQTTDVAGGGSPLSLSLMQNTPNPVRFATRIALATTRTGRVTLSIYDVRGKLVRTLVDGVLPGGRHDVGWDGANARGRSVPSGVYLVRLAAEGRSLARKLAVTR